MLTYPLKITLIFITILGTILINCTEQNTSTDQANVEAIPVKRVGMVIRLREDMIEEYKRLHAADNAGVRDILSKYNMRNFNIFLHKLDDGNYYEFSYYEYVGKNFEEDMRKLSSEPRNQAWLELCDPMQIPLEGYESWAEMDQVYFNE